MVWLCLNDAFLSIVSKDCARDELMVRARREGDIQKIFPDATVYRSTDTDYLFRAVLRRSAINKAITGEFARITYPNFKDSVQDDALHAAYLRIWSTISTLQPTRPYSGGLGKEPLTPARRSEIARNAANARWGNR